MRDLSPAAVGGRLFDALFHGRARALLDRSIGLVHGRGQGLRLVFHIELENPETEPLSRLPWELLFDKEAEEFLALDPRTPVVRYLASIPQPRFLQPLREPPRVLAAVGWAEGLDENTEIKKVAESLADSGVDLEPLNDATAERLARRLRRHKIHILHFIGHGDFDRATGEGRLYLRDGGAGNEALKGSEIASLLNHAGELRFAFLNACSTAETGGGRRPQSPGPALPPLDSYTAGYYGILWGIPLLALLLLVTWRYPLLRRGDSFEERLPVAFGVSLVGLGSLRRVYQAASFTLVLLLPVAAQVHFCNKVRQVTVLDWGEPKREEPVDLKHGVWTFIPICQLNDSHWNRFKFGDDTTYYPFWGTLGLLILELGLLALFMAIVFRLFARPGTARPWRTRVPSRARPRAR